MPQIFVCSAAYAAQKVAAAIEGVSKMKILFAASEALPFAASGGLADVAGSLPAALSQ